ncbi:MAG: NAD-dependent deacylase [Bacteroidetes bacterium]|nr:NAD-dependent deacylase [Bacteroidota bacterium]
MKQIVVLTGAGMSAESGIKTFRDDDGLWRSHRFEDLATPEAWQRNPQLVLDFYNERRKQLFEVAPNAGHIALAKLENSFDVQIVTQNVDDLHERAGSKNVLHLHGELKKVRSTTNPSLVYTMDHWELKLGDVCAEGGQLRPHIVWFGEAVPNIGQAISLVKKADLLLVIGTSLQVYPAASLIGYAPHGVPVVLIDPKASPATHHLNLRIIRQTAAVGVPVFVDELLHNLPA